MPTEFELTMDKDEGLKLNKLLADKVEDNPSDISEIIGDEEFNAFKEEHPDIAEAIDIQYGDLYDTAKDLERERDELKAKMEAYKEIIRIMAGHE